MFLVEKHLKCSQIHLLISFLYSEIFKVQSNILTFCINYEIIIHALVSRYKHTPKEYLQ